jgi:hypothetical protein
MKCVCYKLDWKVLQVAQDRRIVLASEWESSGGFYLVSLAGRKSALLSTCVQAFACVHRSTVQPLVQHPLLFGSNVAGSMYLMFRRSLFSLRSAVERAGNQDQQLLKVQKRKKEEGTELVKGQ